MLRIASKTDVAGSGASLRGRFAVPIVDPRLVAGRVWLTLERQATWIALAASLAVVYALYGRALAFSFLFDDTFDLSRVEGRSYWQLLSSSEGYSYYRPIPFLIWKTLRDTQGHYDQATLHALPLLAHAVAGWCLFLLLRRLGAGLWAAFPGLLFLTFPFHYQNIAVVGTLFHPLTGAAMLGSLVLYERARSLDVQSLDTERDASFFATAKQVFVARMEPRLPVILSRSEGSPLQAPAVDVEGRSFAAAQDDRAGGTVLVGSDAAAGDPDTRVRSEIVWHVAALVLTLIALWAHESGVVVAGLIVLLEAVVLWRAGNRKPSRWVAAHLVAAVLFFLTWSTVEKAPFTDRTSLDELQPKALFFLQGFTWPLSAQTYWIQENLGIPGGITIAAIGLLDIGLAALLAVFVAYGLSAWRVRRWELLAVPAIGLAIGVAASAPSLWRLSWAYVENSPRLLYLVAIGASIFWGLLPALRFRHERLTWAWRAVTTTLLVLVVIQSWRFIDIRMEMWESGTEMIDEIVTTGEMYEGRRILVMNAPSWFAQGIYEYPYGHLGVQLMPSYIGFDRVIYTSSERSAEVETESGTWNVDTSSGRYGFGPHGPERTPEQIDAFLRDGYELIDVRPVGGNYPVRDVGRIEPNGADPDLDHAGSIADIVAVDNAWISAGGGAVTLHVDWHVLDGPPESVTIIEIRDSTGSTVYTYAGYALAGFSSPGLWQDDDLIADSVHVPVPAAGTYTVYVGLQQVLTESPMPATGSGGTTYSDGLLPVGGFVVSETGITSAGSAP